MAGGHIVHAIQYIHNMFLVYMRNSTGYLEVKNQYLHFLLRLGQQLILVLGEPIVNNN